jgi:hypothetical protein
MPMSAVAAAITAHDRPRRGRTPGPEGLTIREAAQASGIPYHTLYDRVARQGMTLDQAVARGTNPKKQPHPAGVRAAPAIPWGLTPEQAAVQSVLSRWSRPAQ